MGGLPMSRPRQDPSDDRSRTAFETHLWRAVETGSVVAMRLWVELHPEDFQTEEAGVDLFAPVGNAEES